MPGIVPFIPSIAQGVLGLGQMLFSGRKKANRELNALQAPTYEGSKPISEYYNTALQRYNVAPTESAMYRRNRQNVQRGVATGLDALRGRGSSLAGVNKLIAGQNQAMLNTEAQAEQERNQRFGQLGQATGMKSQDEMQQFNINKMMPFQRKDRLAQMKLGAANARFDAGISNLFGAGGSASMAANPPQTNYYY